MDAVVVVRLLFFFFAFARVVYTSTELAHPRIMLHGVARAPVLYPCTLVRLLQFAPCLGVKTVILTL